MLFNRLTLIFLHLTLIGESFGWAVIPSNTIQPLYAIEEQGRLVVGAGGTILYDQAIHLAKSPGAHSYNVNYQPMASGTNRNLFGVHCINTCWVVGDSGTLLQQSGSAWVSRASGTNKALRSVYFSFDSDSGFVAGDSGTILKKNGNAWSNIPSGVTQNLYAIQFQYNYLGGTNPNRFDTGFTVGAGGVILKSTNKGATWNQLASGVTHSFHSFHFWDNSPVGFVVGAGGTILKTVNRGATWTSIPSGTTKTLSRIFFGGPQYTANQSGIIVGQDGTMLVTSNGGDTWSMANSGTTQTLYSVVLEGISGGIGVGEAGTIIASNPPVSISAPLGNARSAGLSVRLKWSQQEGLHLRDTKGNLYDLKGQRLLVQSVSGGEK